MWKSGGRSTARLVRSVWPSIAILAVGVGSACAAFGVIRMVVWRATPFTRANQLVSITTGDSRLRSNHDPVSLPDSEDYKRLSHSIADLAVYAPDQVVITWSDSEQETVRAVTCDLHLLDILDVSPMLGGQAGASTAAHGGDDPLLVSYSFWRDRSWNAPGRHWHDTKDNARPSNCGWRNATGVRLSW